LSINNLAQSDGYRKGWRELVRLTECSPRQTGLVVGITPPGLPASDPPQGTLPSGLVPMEPDGEVWKTPAMRQALRELYESCE
jgi:hypothetical protein